MITGDTDIRDAVLAGYVALREAMVAGDAEALTRCSPLTSRWST